MHYQKIDFGGTTFDGKDRSPEYESIFPNPPTGKTILDIGCNLGYYSLRAGLEGAKRVVGIDNHQPFIDDANRVKNELSLDNVNFECIDFMNYPVESFDIVLCLYVMHHLPTPQKVENWLTKMNKIAKRMIVLGVLDCDKGIEIRKNKIGNPKIHMAGDFIGRTLTNVEAIGERNSQITVGRKVIFVWKKQ